MQVVKMAKELGRKARRMTARIMAKFWVFMGPTFMTEHGKLICKTIDGQGKNCYIGGGTRIINPECLILGDYVRIGQHCHLFCSGGLEIGDNTSLSNYVTIYTGNHKINGNAIPYNNDYDEKPVRIGRHVWIGMHVCITPGVTIGDGSIIAMGTVISKDVPPGAVMVSGEQRQVKQRDMSRFYELDKHQSWFGILFQEKN
jgi:acetyltransferase-like isoleucine patch superfamily enzyme